MVNVIGKSYMHELHKHIHSPKKVKDIIFFGYFLLNCNDKSRIIKKYPQKK